MKDIVVKRHRSIDYRRIIHCLGLESEFIKYFYVEHPRLISPRRQARYFLQSKKVDLFATDCFIKQQNIWDYSDLIIASGNNLGMFYIDKEVKTKVFNFDD